MRQHPPYHLRPNKAVDRYLLIEILNLFTDWAELSGYTYYGFGGPYLEDCRLIHEHLPDINLISIENDLDTYLRQEFHKFTSKLTCRHCELGYEGFLSDEFVEGTKAVIWLDYTDFAYKNLKEFISTIEKVGVNSIVRLTLPAKLEKALINMSEDERTQFVDKFSTDYNDLLPPAFDVGMMTTQANYRNLVCQMVRMASIRAELDDDIAFHPISISHYSDGTEMVSATGVVCRKIDIDAINELFGDWRFFRSEFNNPHKIDVPYLTLKERLWLERYLPYQQAPNLNIGEQLRNALNYNIDRSQMDSVFKLQQYGDFYRHYPSFVKALL